MSAALLNPATPRLAPLRGLPASPAAALETLVDGARADGATEQEIQALRSFAAMVDATPPEQLAREREEHRVRRELYAGDVEAEGRAWREGTHPLLPSHRRKP